VPGKFGVLMEIKIERVRVGVHPVDFFGNCGSLGKGYAGEPRDNTDKPEGQL
jgi:hypothetical protein